MRLCSITLAEEREEWLWYALASAAPALETLVVAGLGARPECRERAGQAAGERLCFLDLPAYTPRPEALGVALAEARGRGATHLLLLGPCEVWARRELFWCRRLLQETTLQGARLGLPPRQHGRRHDPEPTDGVLLRQLAVRKLRPSRVGLTTGELEPRPVVRWLCLEDLLLDPEGTLREPTGEELDRSPWRLKLPTTPFWDLSRLLEGPGEPFPSWAALPQVLRDPAGPGHPQLGAWGLLG